MSDGITQPLVLKLITIDEITPTHDAALLEAELRAFVLHNETDPTLALSLDLRCVLCAYGVG
jgi:hypothetical protein